MRKWCSGFDRGHGSTRTGTPVRCAIPASFSRSSGALDINRLTFAPPAPLAVRQPPVPLWPQPCGTATTPATMSLVTMTGSSISPCGDAMRTVSPSTMFAAAASSTCMRAYWTRSPRISSGALCIHEFSERDSRMPISRIG